MRSQAQNTEAGEEGKLNFQGHLDNFPARCAWKGAEAESTELWCVEVAPALPGSSASEILHGFGNHPTSTNESSFEQS